MTNGRRLRKLIARAIPLIYGIFFVSVAATLVATFLVLQIVVSDSSRPSLIMGSLSYLAAIPGFLVPSWLPLFPWERKGGLDGPLRLRWYRQFTNNGERIRRLMAAISPETVTRLDRSSVAIKKAEFLFGERFHWGVLFWMLPASVWAAVLQNYGFVLVFSMFNIVGNLWPIVLLRRMRARVERVESHPRYTSARSRAGGAALANDRC